MIEILATLTGIDIDMLCALIFMGAAAFHLAFGRKLMTEGEDNG